MSLAIKRIVICVAISATSLTFIGCGVMGDTKNIKEGSNYAVDCQPDKALAALDQAQLGGGLGTYLAELEKIVVLRDAGRDKQAAEALKAYYAKNDIKPDDYAETEKSIQNSVNELQNLRLNKTGNKRCSK